MYGLRVRWVPFDLDGTLLDPSGIAEPLGGGDAERGLAAEAFRDALLLTMAAPCGLWTHVSKRVQQ